MGQAPLRDWQFRLVGAVHRWVSRATGGRVGGLLGGMATLELHTTGRSSGRPRTCMLTAPVHDGQRVVLVASKGGGDHHPQWYLNLVAHPDVELVIGGRRLPMRARTASPKEKAELWPEVVAAYAGYAAYQRRTDRDIPVVICEPR